LLKFFHPYLVTGLTGLFITLKGIAQPDYYYNIQSYGAEDGFKPYQTISYITEDNSGLLWIGTDNGLFNFDGRFFKLYNHKYNVSTSAPSNLIQYNYQDKQGRCWANISAKGLYNFLPKEGVFKKFTAANEKEFNINDYQVSLPFEDSDGNLWFGILPYGIAKYDRTNNTFIPTKICFPGNCGRFRTASWVSKFFEDPADKSFWLVTNQGLVHFYPNTGKYDVVYDNAFENTLTDGTAIFTSICTDKHNDLWLGTWGQGIKKFNRKKKTFETWLPYPTLINGTRNICEGIAVRDSSTFWVSSLDQGLLVFNVVSGKFTKVFQTSQLTSFNTSQSLYQSKNGTVWFYSDKKLLKLNPQENLFSFHPFSKEANKGNETGVAESFITGNKRLFIGSYYNGAFYEYDLQSEKFKNYALPNGKNKYDVAALAKDANGNIWMATSQGTFLFNTVSNKISSLPVLSGNKDALKFSSTAIVFDKDNNAWISTSYNGLVKYNTGTKNAVLFTAGAAENNKLPANKIRTLCCDAQGNIWVGVNVFGIGCLKKGDSSFIFFNTNRNKNYTQSNCSSIAVNSLGQILFVLDNEGLFLLENPFTGKEKMTNVNSFNVLPSEHVNNVMIDAAKRTWVFSSAGISLLDLQAMQGINFTQKEGLSANDFEGNTYQDEAGNIFAESKNGFQVFNPDSILKRYTITQIIHFSDFRINGKPYQATPADISDGHAITLNPDENNISFQFAALSTSFSNLIRYAYRLKGYDNDWIETDRNTAVYSNLPPGNYVLQIKTRYFTDNWNGNFFSMPITIKTPWYRQWWFIVLCLLLAASLLYTFYRYRINTLREKLKLKTTYDIKIAEIEMKALRAQMNPHFIFNCLNSINRYIVKSDEKTASSYLTKFSKLIRLILDNSAAETISIEKEMETLKLYIDMEALRFDHVFDYTIEAAAEIQHNQTEIPSMLIQPYVENAIWHGLLHKEHERGLLNIHFSKPDDKTVVVTIRDNGVGREKADEQKSKDALKRKSYGMQITSDRIKLINNLYKMNATVTINDLKNVDGNATGTEVVIHIPVK
jgi:ligand-binding sensor domain-containing protein/anti-sigma regulatory factor (Ser/Thr protein kinase)